MLQVGKRDVTINEVEAVGHYAIRPTFSDGHNTGIFSWDYLYELGDDQEELWQEYLDRLQKAGASRDPARDEQVLLARDRGRSFTLGGIALIVIDNARSGSS